MHLWRPHCTSAFPRATVAGLGASQAALKARVEALAPAQAGGGGGRGGGFGGRGGGAGPSGPPTFNAVSQAMMNAAMAMQEAEAAPTARQIAAHDAARAQLQDVMRRWEAIKASRD